MQQWLGIYQHLHFRLSKLHQRVSSAHNTYGYLQLTSCLEIQIHSALNRCLINISYFFRSLVVYLINLYR